VLGTALAIASQGARLRRCAPRQAVRWPEYRTCSRLVELKVAERYTSQDWLKQLLNLLNSRILARIRSHLSCNAAFASAVCFINARVCRLAEVPVPLMTACVTALGLLLIFRTSTAYDRWWAGHKCTLAIIQDLHQIRRLARLWMREEDLEFLNERLRVFPAKLQGFLTNNAHGSNGEDPREIIADVGAHVHHCGRGEAMAALDVYSADRVQGHVCSALGLVEEMAQLSSVAVARNYSRHTSRFLALWTLVLPFVLIEMGYVMPVAVAVVSWALLGIEEIGHCLEDPFNSPTEPVLVKEMINGSLGWE